MGGIKDRETKKKRNNVFSSGGGGGTKGPAKIDKRNQELQCPHCDRVFKQVQRYREHIEKRHADDADAEEPDEKGEAGPSSSKQEMVMDVGSQGGAWTKKSPKLLLLEWAQAQKRSKPRYKALPEAEGKFRCKVVLADPKDGVKDMVVFLEASQAAETEEDAQQAGALAALHRVAGDRAMHRILPQQYLPAWEWHGQQAERRQQQQLSREAAAVARNEREKARRMAEARKAPAQVIMSAAQRQMLESVLGELREGSSGVEAAAELTGMRTSTEDAEAQLRRLGFGGSDIEAALSVAASEGGGVSLSHALDWLCINLPESRLPQAFAAGSSAQPVELVKPRTDDNWGVQEAAPSCQLASYGYSSVEITDALRSCGGDQEAAFARLYLRLTGQDVCGLGAPVRSEEWEEELTALEAIYREDVSVVGADSLRLRIDDGRLTLDVRQRPGARYPDAAPLIGCKSEGVPASALLQLTRRLASTAESLLGNQMVYDLALAAPGLLHSVLSSPAATAAAARPDVDEAAAEFRQDSLDAALAQIAAEKGPAPEMRGSTRREQRAGRPHRARTVDVEKESQRLLEAATKQPGAKQTEMQEARRRLPAFSQRLEVLALLQRHQVLVISGATGCGKSTQVPQYILEEAITAGAGGSCNIVCTQPRRISAIGLAHRVSQERGEATGDVVGYSVRFDSKTSARTRLLFCTTGILLRRLLAEPDLGGTSHVIIDEVHERSTDSDLLLLLMRSLLGSGKRPGLKLVLMSATADAGLFADYFSRAAAGHRQGGEVAGIASIPGFTHPVADRFLEDALELTNFSVSRNSRWAKKRGQQQSREAGQTDTADGQGAVAGQAEGQYSEQTLRSLAVVDEALVNYDLLELLICHVVSNRDRLLGQQQEEVQETGSRAILVFLPGAPEISRLVRTLQQSPVLRRAAQGSKLQVLPLHGSLPAAEQGRVFARAGPGVQKIVVATNVAETSITIDDVVCVIDTGRVKEMGYDPMRGLSCLEETWVSRAAAAQRRGRAGRVQPGICFKLFSRRQMTHLKEHQPPEVLRVPLQQLCLTVKATLPGSAPVADTLSQLLTPPAASAVAAAVDELRRMGALTPEEDLTPLGSHLAQMPMDAKLGKALIYGAMLRCLSPVLTIVAAMAFGRPVFLSPPDKREEAQAAKRLLLSSSAATRKSDHLAVIAAFSAWSQARESGGPRASAKVSSDLFLSEATMEGILAGRADYAATLDNLGFTTCPYSRLAAEGRLDTSSGGLDEFSDNGRIVKAALCAGFYPSLLRVEHPAAKYTETAAGAFQTDADPVKLRFYDRIKGRVFMHPASVNFNVGRFESPWLIYTDLTETSKVFCREASMVPLYSLLLFSGEISVDHAKSLLTLDRWATLKAPARVAVLARELRSEISKLLAKKVAQPALDLSKSKAISALHSLLATDGF